MLDLISEGSFFFLLYAHQVAQQAYFIFLKWSGFIQQKYTWATVTTILFAWALDLSIFLIWRKIWKCGKKYENEGIVYYLLLDKEVFVLSEEILCVSVAMNNDVSLVSSEYQFISDTQFNSKKWMHVSCMRVLLRANSLKLLHHPRDI